MHGDFLTAFKMNSLGVVLMPLILLLLGREIVAWAWDRPKWRPGTFGKWGIWLGSLVIFYGVLRNIPGFEFLQPGGW